MTLNNLVRIGQLKPHSTSRAEIGDLLSAARRNLADARAENISTENRFDAAYKCIMQSAMAALMSSGYRPDTKKPGHHQTTILSLPKTIGLDASRIVVLDSLRNKRNLSDYTGKPIDPAYLSTCNDEADRLLNEVGTWLADNHPALAP